MKSESMKKAKPDIPQQTDDVAEVLRDDTTLIVAKYTPSSVDNIWSFGSDAIFDLSKREKMGEVYDLFAQRRKEITVVADAAEHEKTRMLISEKLEEVAKKDDVIQAKEEIIASLNKQVEELENELKAIRHESSESLQELRELRRCLEHFAPPKRFFRVTLGFFLFFLLSQIFGFALGLRIVDPFWANTGVVITALILVVIYFAKNEIDERLNRKNIQ